ncbi:hypothetical protein EDD11_000848 [Mortierella claussenii]|nr:hypothetical protein EDD11_000848 [Mortierella claussenii]
MSAPPPEQPVYYTPTPAAGTISPAPLQGDGTQQQHQYVVPQHPAPPYQYVQQPFSPEQQQQGILTQPYYTAQSPAVAPQQVYTNPAQSPVPQNTYVQPGFDQGKPLQSPVPQNVYAQPTYDQQQQQQAYFAQQQPAPGVQQQPSTFIVQEHTATEMPVVTGNGRGLTGKMPQLAHCCCCLPLHTGALIIAALMTIYYGYCGIALFAAGGLAGGVFIAYIIIGILYIAIAIVSGYGFMGIYQENPTFVDRFIKMFIIGSLVWLALQILYMIIVVASGIALFWVSWIVQIIVSGGLQYFFCVCLVSYQRVLHTRVGGGEKI